MCFIVGLQESIQITNHPHIGKIVKISNPPPKFPPLQPEQKM